MDVNARAACLFAVACVAACGGQPRPPKIPEYELVTPDGEAFDVREAARHARATVVVFFSAGCACQSLHDARLSELDALYRARGVRLYAVDSEVSRTRAAALAEARVRGYAFPILLDRGARLATSVQAEYATFSLVLDASGTIRYRGGFDSDRLKLSEHRREYVRDAVDDVLAGRPVRVAGSKALGCALRTW
jgi:Redoxin